ncbi:hypothetical protein [Algoriphagus hitonicola]|uniref:6-bladed beta-propeller protein n=1 Tax=Algoriphagus hitonicola TaxID=435880 RepID=A0A1I2W320_9BACT|nr:hypothetical protein [Algoriphagus hitonicola]SFG95784.1 hypothetical protein SAMN04487988_111122 [Algoriphagus hitonicola]
MIRILSKGLKILLLAIFLLFGNVVNAQTTFSKIAEFKIDLLNPIQLIDYYPAKELFLGYISQGSKGNKITLFSKTGKVLVSEFLQGEGPNQIVESINQIGFSEEGTIWIHSSQNLYVYDQNLRKLKKMPFNSQYNVTLYSPKKLNFFYEAGVKGDYSFISQPSGHSTFFGFSDFLKENLIEIFNPKSNSLYKMAPVSERSNFSKLDPSIESIYSPVYSLDKSRRKLYLTTTLDDEISIIDLKSQDVPRSIKVDHGDFSVLKSSKISLSNIPSTGPITLGAKNKNIYVLSDGSIVLEYIKAISPGVYEQKLAEDKNYHHYGDPNYHRLIFIEGGRQIGGDIEIPYGEISMLLPDDTFLIKLLNPAEEEDFTRYGIFELR